MAHHDHDNTFGRLDELDDYKVADGYPDIRGWDVITAGGQKIGKVDELIVDTTQMRVRYIDVDLDRSIRDEVRDTADSAKKAATPGSDGVERGHTLLPIGTARLDDDNDQVIVDQIDMSTIGSLPRYDGRRVTREYESSLRNRFGPGGGALGMGAAALEGTRGTDDRAAEMRRGEEMARWYESEHYDDQRLFASRRNRNFGDRNIDGGLDDSGIGDLGISRPERADRDASDRLTLSEEQLDIDKREVRAGEVHLRKTVETEHVSEPVSLSREEVSVERRPLERREMSGAEIGGDQEIRVPLMREEAVAEKRVVPREEIIVRKHAVTENRTVEADLRRERLDTDREVETRRGSDNLRGDIDRTSDPTIMGNDRVRTDLDSDENMLSGDATDRPGR